MPACLVPMMSATAAAGAAAAVMIAMFVMQRRVVVVLVTVPIVGVVVVVVAIVVVRQNARGASAAVVRQRAAHAHVRAAATAVLARLLASEAPRHVAIAVAPVTMAARARRRAAATAPIVRLVARRADRNGDAASARIVMAAIAAVMLLLLMARASVAMVAARAASVQILDGDGAAVAVVVRLLAPSTSVLLLPTAAVDAVAARAAAGAARVAQRSQRRRDRRRSRIVGDVPASRTDGASRDDRGLQLAASAERATATYDGRRRNNVLARRDDARRLRAIGAHRCNVKHAIAAARRVAPQIGARHHDVARRQPTVTAAHRRDDQQRRIGLQANRKLERRQGRMRRGAQLARPQRRLLRSAVVRAAAAQQQRLNVTDDEPWKLVLVRIHGCHRRRRSLLPRRWRKENGNRTTFDNLPHSPASPPHASRWSPLTTFIPVSRHSTPV